MIVFIVASSWAIRSILHIAVLLRAKSSWLQCILRRSVPCIAFGSSEKMAHHMAHLDHPFEIILFDLNRKFPVEMPALIFVHHCNDILAPLPISASKKTKFEGHFPSDVIQRCTSVARPKSLQYEYYGLVVRVVTQRVFCKRNDAFLYKQAILSC